jgi:hypothetical protein
VSGGDAGDQLKQRVRRRLRLLVRDRLPIELVARRAHLDTPTVDTVGNAAVTGHGEQGEDGDYG